MDDQSQMFTTKLSQVIDALWSLLTPEQIEELTADDPVAIQVCTLNHMAVGLQDEETVRMVKEWGRDEFDVR